MVNVSNLGNGNQIRDGLEPCDVDTAISDILAKDDTAIMIDWMRELFGDDVDLDSRFTSAQMIAAMEHAHEEAMEFAEMVNRAKAKANQSSLDTMGGRIEELSDVLEAVDAMFSSPGRINKSAIRDRVRAVLGPVSRSHASHQAPVGLGRSGFDRGQSK